jgi:hypothetical protein
MVNEKDSPHLKDDGINYLTCLLIFLTLSLVLLAAVPMLEQGKIIQVVVIIIGSAIVAGTARVLSQQSK